MLIYHITYNTKCRLRLDSLPQMGPVLGPWTLLSGKLHQSIITNTSLINLRCFGIYSSCSSNNNHSFIYSSNGKYARATIRHAHITMKLVFHSPGTMPCVYIRLMGKPLKPRYNRYPIVISFIIHLTKHINGLFYAWVETWFKARLCHPRIGYIQDMLHWYIFCPDRNTLNAGIYPPLLKTKRCNSTVIGSSKPLYVVII